MSNSGREVSKLGRRTRGGRGFKKRERSNNLAQVHCFGEDKFVLQLSITQRLQLSQRRGRGGRQCRLLYLPQRSTVPGDLLQARSQQLAQRRYIALKPRVAALRVQTCAPVRS